MKPIARRTSWLPVTLILLWLVATLRVFALWSHDPLYAYANSYDQTRYTNCFHFYPDRPAAIPPQENSPQAPFSKFRFVATADPMCYWSSELVFTATTALIWKSGEALGTGEVHDVRWVGALRWIALLSLSIAFSIAWLRRGDTRAAVANALLPLLFADPGNTFYLNTFYAEWSALLATYALLALSLLWRNAPFTRARFALLALTAFLLATTKIQHLLLPLALAIVVLVLDRIRLRRFGWRGIALACGALCGFGVQFVQLHRDGAMMSAIDQYNRADVVFTALLPFAADRAALLDELGIDPACAIYNEHHAWEFPDLPENVCRGLSDFTRGKEIATLLKHPGIALGLAVHGVLGLDPWIAKNLGQVEGSDFATMPSTQPGIGRFLHAWPSVQLAILALPFLALIVLLFRPGLRNGTRALDYAALCSTLMIATLAITVLGDGLADVAKQGHLLVNAALAFLLSGVVFALWRIKSRPLSQPAAATRA